jgi:hypothetical protein
MVGLPKNRALFLDPQVGPIACRYNPAASQEPVNKSFEGRFTVRKAHFRFLAISIPRIVDNHAAKISNANQSQPEVQVRCLMVERGRYGSAFNVARPACAYRYCLLHVQERTVLSAVVGKQIVSLRYQVN